MFTPLPFALPYIRYADVVPWKAGNLWGPRRLYDHELLYVLSGAVRVQLGERMLHLGADQLILISPRVRHQFEVGREAHRHIGIHFDWAEQPDTEGFREFRAAEKPVEEELFREARQVPDWNAERHPVLDLRGRPRVRQLLLEAVSAHKAGHARAAWQSGALLAAAMGAISHEAALARDAAANPHPGADAVRRVHLAREFLEAETAAGARPRTVAAAAAQVGWSPDHLTRMCKQVLDATPSALQRRARMQQARQLLRYGDSRVAEVAERCGFEDVGHFCRVFKRETGLTPHQFLHSG